LLYTIIAGPDGRVTPVQPVPVDELPDLEQKELRIACRPLRACLSLLNFTRFGQSSSW
jgi:hypothetical protein